MTAPLQEALQPMLRRPEAARCLGMTDEFDSTVWTWHLRARVLCSTCPLTRDCLDNALAQARDRSTNCAVPNGTWGGLLWRDGQIVTSGERRTLQHGTDSGYYHHRTNHDRPCTACTQAHEAAQAADA